MSNNRKYFVGQEWEVPSGRFKIVELDLTTYKHANVVWLADGNTQRIRLDVITKGNIKNPMFPSVCGVGYLGVGKYSEPNRERYNSWSSMIARCYRPALKEKFPTYRDATCDSGWLNYQNYCEFYEADEYRKSGWNLDKDLLVLGNKHYSPETCTFLPGNINNFALSMPATKKGHGYRGVALCPVSNKWMSVIKSKEAASGKTTGGRYSDIKCAAREFLEYEIRHINSIISKYTGTIEPRAISAFLYRIQLVEKEIEEI